MKRIYLLISFMLLLFFVSCENVGVTKYKITYMVSDEVVHTVYVYDGKTLPDYQYEKEGLTFIGWMMDDNLIDYDFVIHSDITLYGLVKINHDTHIVRFYNELNELISEQFVTSGTDACPPPISKDGYTFVSWSSSYENVETDLDIFPIFSKNKIKVTYLDMNKNIIYIEDVDYGSSAKYVYSYNKDGLTFTKWDKELSYITDNVTVNAIYEKKTYYVSFVNKLTNKIVHKVPVYYGDSVDFPSNEDLAVYGYKYQDNISELSLLNNITSSFIFYLSYTKENFTITIDYECDDVVITYQYLDTVQLPKGRELPGFDFIGFDRDNFIITQDEVVKPLYKPSSYSVKFYGFNDKLLKEVSASYQQELSFPDLEEVDGYRFVKWSHLVSSITTDLNVYAIYEKNSYEVKFVDLEENVLSIVSVLYNESAIPPVAPKIDGKVFKNWSEDISCITNNLTVYPVYIEKSEVDYKITFDLNGGSFDYLNKMEYINGFLTEFHSFVKCKATIDNFIHGSDGAGYDGLWTSYVGGNYPGENHFLYNNDLSANNEDYFCNSSMYKDNYGLIAKWIFDMNGRLGGTSYQYGTLDLFRYVTDDPYIYASTYGEMFNSYPASNIYVIKSYSPNVETLLPKPLSQTFAGWYLNKEGVGPSFDTLPIGTTGDLVLYAKWDNTTSYRLSFDTSGGDLIGSLKVKTGDVVVLPTPSKYQSEFIGWMLDNIIVSSPFTFTYLKNITLKAVYKDYLTELVYDNTVYYRGTSNPVMIPTKYIQNETQFRGVWISSFISDFTPSTNESIMKQNLIKVLDKMEEYGLNAAIFHLRTHNNALYKTHLAPIHSSYGDYSDFERFDYLPWLIDECHKRGIEFHAWLNPYRIKNGSSIVTKESIANEYKDYPLNPASNPSNILVSSDSKKAILDPGKEEVRDYIINVCLELSENYDIDAIHFDDYFYIDFGYSSILNDPDQSTFLDNRMGFANTKAGKQEWRKEQVNIFIRDLHEALTLHNKQMHKGVELGVSPTGIYKNGNGIVTYDGDGNAITTGSNTKGQEHVNSYLYCDTLKWVNNEWIDYILPQSYWGFTHPSAGFADVADWWNQVVKYKKVNLYLGMGLYMSLNENTYSWKSQSLEAANQILYANKLENVKGHCIFSFKSISSCEKSVQKASLDYIRSNYFNYYVSPPKTIQDNYRD